MNEAYLKLALNRAKLTHSQTSPNPNIGVVYVKNFRHNFIASIDLIPTSTGKGMRILLRVAKNDAITDSSKKEADVNNQAFYHQQRTYTNYEDAATLDGLLAKQNGNCKWSISANLRLNLHPLRSTHDANPIGVNSNLQINPFLTTRLPHGGKNPIQYLLKRHPSMPIKTGHDLSNPALKTCNFKLKLNDSSTYDSPIVHVESIPEMFGGVC